MLMNVPPRVPGQIFAARTRRSGTIADVEITLGFAQNKTMGEVSRIIARMQDHLRDANLNSDIVIVPRAVRWKNNQKSVVWEQSMRKVAPGSSRGRAVWSQDSTHTKLSIERKR